MFQSTPPCGARLESFTIPIIPKMFQSTRPVRGATGGGIVRCASTPVSIHAPHAGRDFRIHPARVCNRRFNPRAPCGARHSVLSSTCALCLFQSTRPVRGATCGTGAPSLKVEFQSTRPVRGATRAAAASFGRALVSIHAPRAGRDPSSWSPRYSRCVSIHAPRAGRDHPSRGAFRRRACFNPRAPCGARPITSRVAASSFEFQSTRPVRGATC